LDVPRVSGEWSCRLAEYTLYNQDVKIYTRTGDSGDTGLFDGTRVPKSDPRVAAYGDVDELNAWLGLARAELPDSPRRSADGAPADSSRRSAEGAPADLSRRSAEGAKAEIAPMLDRIQRDLFALGARLADPGRKIAERVTKAAVTAEDISRLESWIDLLESELPPLRRFILAGGSRAGAALHVARTICRRAERSMVSLGAEAFESDLLVYVNRLSDLLFVMARAVNRRAGAAETEW
jgi:cob(I)alamin adenosyltransferase